MTILDRYLLWSFFKVLAVALLSLTGLYVVIDFFNNFDEFSRHGPAHGGWFALAAKYYAPRVLSFFDTTSAILTLIASLFTLAWLQSTNELTALLAAGIPKRRIVAPLIAGAMFVTVLAVANRELLLPQYRDQLSRNMQDIDGNRPRPVRPVWDRQSDLQIGGQNCYSRDKSIERPSIQLPAHLATHFGQFLTAEVAFHREASEDHPRGYLLRQLRRPKSLDTVPSIHWEERPVILTPADQAWLKPGECFVVSEAPFEQLSGGREWRQYSSTFDLIEALLNPSLEYGPDVRVTVHARMVQPLLDLTLLMLGLPLVLSRDRGNLFFAIGLCVLLVAIYYVVILGSHMAGMRLYFSDSFAAWAPLLIMAPIAAFISDPVRNG